MVAGSSTCDRSHPGKKNSRAAAQNIFPLERNFIPIILSQCLMRTRQVGTGFTAISIGAPQFFAKIESRSGTRPRMGFWCLSEANTQKIAELMKELLRGSEQETPTCARC